MTPDDLAERRNWDSAAWRHRDIVLLMDALEAAWAERDDAIANAVDNYNDAERWRERAECAEAERDAERCACGTPHYCQAELDVMMPKYRDDWLAMKRRAERAELMLSEFKDASRKDIDRLMLRAERAEAALDRVRDLCDLVETYDHPVAWHTEIRAAIEGDNQ